MNFVSSITLMFKDAFSPGFTQAKNSFAGMKDAISTINDNSEMNKMAADIAMMTALTDPLRQKLSAVMDEPSRLAGTFESSMKNIRAITGLSADAVARLGNELREIGMGTAGGPLAVAAAYNDVAGGITNVEAQMPVLTNAIALAEAGQADLGAATNGLVKIMNSYNFVTSQAATETERIGEVNERAAWASDVLTQAVGMGVGSMNEFIAAIAPVSGVASSVGIGLDEIGSTMAYMTATTDTANTAGTKLQAFMIALQRPSDSLAAALEKIGITSGSAMLAEYGLAESAAIVSRAFGGNQDAMVQAMGRMEAVKAVMSLTGDSYVDFARQFGEGMGGITETARAIQVEAYESKVGRLNAATDALKIQTGDNVNAIKGLFVDLGAGFLTYVVSPIMSSPIGEAFQWLGAGVGIAAKSVLDLGSGALNTASQLAVLTASIQNAGGIAKLFTSTIGLMGSALRIIGAPLRLAGGGLASLGKMIIGIIPVMGGYIASMWSAAAATIAATWPILAIVAGVAVLAAGAYLIIKNWGAVSGFFSGLWGKITGAFSAAWEGIKNVFLGLPNWVLGLIAVFFPFISLPVIIVKNWGAITGFFVSLWGGIKTTATACVEWLGGLWAGAVSLFTTTWGHVSEFFADLWNGIVSILAGFAEWAGGLWSGIAGAFATAWGYVAAFFSPLWEGFKQVILDFVTWVRGIVDFVIAPFRAMAEGIGGALDKIGGWFKGLIGDSKTASSELSATVAETQTAATPALPAAATATVPTPIAAPALPVTTTAVTPAPVFTAAPVVPVPPVVPDTTPLSVTASAGASLASSRIGLDSPEISHTASGAFAGAMATPAFSAAPPVPEPRIAPAVIIPPFAATASAGAITDIPPIPAYDQDAAFHFPEAMPMRISGPAQARETAPLAEPAPVPSVTIHNAYFQAEDVETVFDLIKMLYQAAHRPEEAL